MYAVIESGSKQLRVEVGDVVEVERLAGDVGDAVVFDRVLMVGGDSPVVGSPTVAEARVRGSIVSQGRGPKIHIYTYKRRQNSNRKRQGHRQGFTAVKIDKIDKVDKSEAIDS
jgi:large subunit ribosomal protein L21